MFFSKSFGYAVRSVLYIASVQDKKDFVQLEEISTTLKLPRQFLARVLKNLVKQKILVSFKGPTGGFAVSKEGMQAKLITILELTDGNRLEECVLKSGNCNAANPCPAHDQFALVRRKMSVVLSSITIHSLLKGDQKQFIKSLIEEA
jgi:Rrf2 family transcriptional regulator, iron-sulfur cluster assembly transcription factor